MLASVPEHAQHVLLGGNAKAAVNKGPCLLPCLPQQLVAHLHSIWLSQHWQRQHACTRPSNIMTLLRLRCQLIPLRKTQPAPAYLTGLHRRWITLQPTRLLTMPNAASSITDLWSAGFRLHNKPKSLTTQAKAISTFRVAMHSSCSCPGH